MTPALDAALHLSPQDTACVERAGHDLGALVDITGGSYERHLRLDLLQRDADAILGGWDPAAWSPEDMDTDSIFEHAPAAAEGAPAAAGRPPAPRPVPAAGLPATMHFVPVAPAPTRPAAAPAPAPTAGAGGGNFGRALDFAWMTPGPGDKPRQGQAKSNATILLTGARHSISVNSLLQEDNAIFERLLPPLLHARGLSLGHPQRLLLRAVVLALLEGIPSEVLAERYGLPQVAQLRADRVMDRAMIEELFPRRKKGTTKYDLCPGLAQVRRACEASRHPTHAAASAADVTTASCSLSIPGSPRRPSRQSLVSPSSPPVIHPRCSRTTTSPGPAASSPTATPCTSRTSTTRRRAPTSTPGRTLRKAHPRAPHVREMGHGAPATPQQPTRRRLPSEASHLERPPRLAWQVPPPALLTAQGPPCRRLPPAASAPAASPARPSRAHCRGSRSAVGPGPPHACARTCDSHALSFCFVPCPLASA